MSYYRYHGDQHYPRLGDQVRGTLGGDAIEGQVTSVGNRKVTVAVPQPSGRSLMIRRYIYELALISRAAR